MNLVPLPVSHTDLLDSGACVALTTVEMTEEGALEHLDQLTQLYLHRSDARFFGDSVATQLQATYVPVKVKIAPTRIRVEG